MGYSIRGVFRMKKTVLYGLVISVFACILGSAPAVRAKEQGKEELKLQLPKPMFIGTPRNINSPNLEKITGKPRGAFFVPAGTKLVSLNKPVIASDTQPGKQYVQIDLKASQPLQAILAWHYHSQARVYRDVVVQVSDDKDFVSGVTTIFNNDHDNSSGLGIGKDREYIETFEGKLFDPRGSKARYVRLWSNGNTSNDMNHYVEVEVYATPAQ
jgi:hypothetical protein